ncbi:MAG: metallophosphoesterase [Spirochaetaceae bacterium]|nr:metallophosphoesterase [Spirochaetaceae bacterium]MBO4706589.1 metallophosphoesterase [Spirochaetaceae bacterium]
MQIQILKNSTKSRIALASIAIVIILITLSVVGCKFGLEEAFFRPNGVNERSKELTTLQLDSRIANSAIYQSGKYCFMILSDVHYGADYDVPEQQIFNWLDSFDTASTQAEQNKKPLFCAVLGDISNTGNREDFAAFNTFQGKLETKGIPVYCIVGNHDLLNSGWNYWKYSCNPHTSFYCFKTSTVSWYFTDTGSGTMGSAQFSALETAFKNDSNRKLVFSHYPLYGGGTGIPIFSIGNTKERAKIIDLYAENNVKYVFEGHWHVGGEYDFGKFKEHIGKTLKSGKWYIVSIDETISTDENPVTAVEEIDIHLQN